MHSRRSCNGSPIQKLEMLSLIDKRRKQNIMSWRRNLVSWERKIYKPPQNLRSMWLSILILSQRRNRKNLNLSHLSREPKRTINSNKSNHQQRRKLNNSHNHKLKKRQARKKKITSLLLKLHKLLLLKSFKKSQHLFWLNKSPLTRNKNKSQAKEKTNHQKEKKPKNRLKILLRNKRYNKLSTNNLPLKR